MSDTLKIFGIQYSDVTGIKASDENGQIKTYIRPQGTKTITQNGTGIDVASFASVDINVSGGGSEINLQSKTATPTESSQTITADSGYDGLSSVEVGAISSTYVGSEIDQRDSTDLTVSGATVTIPAGYYAAQSSKAIAAGSATTPATTITANPTISVSATGLITATASASQNITPTVSAGYVSVGTAGIVSVSGSDTSQLSTQAATTITPTESEQTAVAAGKYTTGVVKVGAISDTYIGSAIDQRDETDLTASGATVTVPAGYYAEQETKSVTTTTHANPVISIDSTTGIISASHTQTAGYVSAGTTTDTEQLSTQSGTTITPTESAQVAVAAGKYTLGAVNVGAISSTYVGSGIDQRDSTDLTASGATVSVPAGYYAAAASKSVASGSEGTPTAAKGTVSNHSISITPSVTNTAGYISGGTHTGTAVSVAASELVSGTLTIDSSGTKDVTNYASAFVAAGSATAPSSISGTAASVSTGTNTLTLSKTVSVTPSVTAGYISSGTAGNSSVSLTADVTTKVAATITPGTTDQTIAAGTYLTGAQTIAGDANLVSSNIISGASIFGVNGSVTFQTIYSGSSDPAAATGSNGDIYIKVVS